MTSIPAQAWNVPSWATRLSSDSTRDLGRRLRPAMLPGEGHRNIDVISISAKLCYWGCMLGYFFLTCYHNILGMHICIHVYMCVCVYMYMYNLYTHICKYVNMFMQYSIGYVLYIYIYTSVYVETISSRNLIWR